eukprot:344846-Amphidinium_carterae.1
MADPPITKQKLLCFLSVEKKPFNYSYNFEFVGILSLCALTGGQLGVAAELVLALCRAQFRFLEQKPFQKVSPEASGESVMEARSATHVQIVRLTWLNSGSHLSFDSLSQAAKEEQREAAGAMQTS